MILLVDNYDSFTYNLYQMVATLGAQVEVVRNDALTVDQILALAPTAVLLSPGPGHPRDAGISPELLARLPEDVPLLGVCLGHQGLVMHYGGELEIDPTPTHGKASLVHHDGGEIFRSLPSPFPAGRYHSLRAVRDRLPKELRLTAWTEGGLVMGVQHVSAPRFGVQFHPESILTPQGERILANFLVVAGEALGAR